MSLVVKKYKDFNFEIIGEELCGSTSLKNPCQVIVQHSPQGPRVALMPMCLLSSSNTIEFYSELIYSYPPSETLTANYNEMFSNIITPEKKGLILP